MGKTSHIDETTVTIQMKDIVKKFGNFVANDHINLTVHKGEVHAILGENGAGKSTLMNVLYGLYRPTEGEIFVGGKPVHIDSPKKAIELGIGMVHQHFMLVQPYTVTENIILGMEPVKGLTVDLDSAREKVRELSERYNMQVDPDAKIEDISVGMQQRAEILKVLYRGADILILDEPTASLTPQEIEELIEIIGHLTNDGKSVILITHKLKEIKSSADYCTIIRQGKYIRTVKVDDVTENELASMMVGRDVEFVVEKKKIEPGDVVLEVKNLHAKDYRGVEILKGLNLNVRKGEIVGLAGLDGSGRTETLENIFGIATRKSGTIKLDGKQVLNRNARESIKNGFALLTEERRATGIFGILNIRENTVVSSLKKHRKFGPFLNEASMKKDTQWSIDAMRTKTPSQETKIRSLSGGNQQKVILGRWLLTDPEVLLLDEPTRGIDVGAKYEIYQLIIDLAKKGKVVIMVSSEMPELLGVCDRILVMSGGRLAGEVDAKNTTQEEIMTLAAKYV